MRGKIRIFLWLFLTWLSALSAVELKIICTADLHGRADHLAYLGAAIRQENPDILIDCGDLFSGNFYSLADGGATMVEALKLLGTEVWVWGNHEFELDFPALRALRAKFPGAVLGEWHSPELPGVLPYVIVAKKGIRCAVIGMGDEHQKERLLPDLPFTAPPAEEFLRRTLAEIRRESVDLIILVWHRGVYSQNGALKKILQNFPEIQLVFGAHTHTANAGQKLGRAYYLQSASYAANAAAAVVKFNFWKRVKTIESYLVEPAATPAEDLAALASAQQAAFTPAAREVLTTLDQPLAQPEPGEFDRGFAKLGAEALRFAAGSDFGVFQCGVGRQTRSGEITRLELFGLYPYRAELIVATLSAEELANLLTEELRRARSAKSHTTFGFAGYSGQLRGAIKPERFPAQSTVALGSFVFCTYPALNAVRSDPTRWHRVGITELTAIENYLKNQKR